MDGKWDSSGRSVLAGQPSPSNRLIDKQLSSQLIEFLNGELDNIPLLLVLIR